MNCFSQFVDVNISECKMYELSKQSDVKKIDIKDLDKPLAKEVPSFTFERNSFLPKSGGEWTGERGNSDWKPNPNLEPADKHGTNPEHKTWEEIMEQYDIESISFKDGEPDFSEVSKGEVEIDDFTDDRDFNFTQADEKMAEQRGCTPEEVAQWRKENKYTWHECGDCKTMQKVPTEVHGNVPHSGGVSEYKKQNQLV